MKRTIVKTSELFDGFYYPEQSWSVPSWVASSEVFVQTLKDLISNSYEEYRTPNSFDELFKHLEARGYALFEERFLVCLSQGRLSYLTSSGFSKVSASRDVFELSNWLIAA